MYRQDVKILIQHIALFGISNKLASKIVEMLRRCGLTKKDMKLLDKYPIKFGWLVALKFYSMNNYELPEVLRIRLFTSMPNVEDIELGIKMTDFLNSPSADKAKKLYDDIEKGIPTDVIKDFFELGKRLDENAAKQNVDLKELLKGV